LPLTISLLSASIWDPPLAGKCEGRLSLIFYARCCAVLPLTNASLTVAPSCLPPAVMRCAFVSHHPCRAFVLCCPCRVAPSSHVAPVASTAFVTHTPVVSRLRHTSPLLRQPPSSCAPLSCRAFVTRCLATSRRSVRTCDGNGGECEWAGGQGGMQVQGQVQVF
jgi:hypothetical protein